MPPLAPSSSPVVPVADAVDEWVSQTLAYTGAGAVTNYYAAMRTPAASWECRVVHIDASMISDNPRNRIYVYFIRRGVGHRVLDVYNYLPGVAAFKSSDTMVYLQPDDGMGVAVLTDAAASYYHAMVWYEMRRRTERVSAEYTPAALRDISAGDTL